MPRPNERMRNCQCGAKRATFQSRCDKCTNRTRWRRRKAWRTKSNLTESPDRT